MSKNKKPKWLVSVIVIMVLLVSACGNNSENTANGSEPGDSAGSPSGNASTIGFTVPTLNNPFFVDMQKGAEQAAAERGLKLIMVGGDNDITKQVKQVEDFIQNKVDAIVIQTVDTTGIVPVIKQANQSGIPVFTTAETPSDGEIVTSIGFDSYESGQNGGEFIAKELNGKGNVVELIGVLGQETSRLKSDGFKDALSKYPDIKLLDSQPAQYDRSTAMTVMENYLQKFPQIDAVYAANDEMALGAVQAIKAAGKLDQIKVMGNDGTDDALKAVKEGEMIATNATPAFIQGYIAIDMADRALKGEKLPATIKEKNFIITKDEVDDAESILKGVEEDKRYWLEQLK
ncbi:ribose-binding protein [Fontibacillus phaseoli]|uniref:Ribose-binding protein n=1 Tax=Fontibacillus phaseoli TaxID=1416533 RepID=A0A369BPT0_9BACL|nr:sugar ABC transporter substrate-binding protein [Fontibacillus phaseoli]RCX23553.1 ribose-binding protein [Fontibacillus phaseoli]